MQTFVDKLYSEIKSILLTSSDNFKIVQSNESDDLNGLEAYTSVENEEEIVSQLISLMKAHKITFIEYEGIKGDAESICGNGYHIKIRKAQNQVNGNEYLSVSVYDFCRFILRENEGEISCNPDSRINTTILFYNDKKVFAKKGKSGKFFPCTIRDVLHFPKEVQSIILNHYSDNSQFYKDIIREQFYAPINLMKLNTYYTKKDYLEKTFKINLPNTVNKKSLTDTYKLCCALSYIKPEQQEHLLNYSDISNVMINPSLRRKKHIAHSVIKTVLINKNPTLNESIIEDYIDLSAELKCSIDILAGKNKIQHYHDELSGKIIKKCLRGKKLKIPESPLKHLKLPTEFTRLDTKKALFTEGERNHNCVCTYIDKINSGMCVIYSADINEEHLTIEIRCRKSKSKKIPYKFYVNQCYKAYNKDCSKQTYEYVIEAVSNASQEAIDKFQAKSKSKMNKATEQA